MVFRDCEDGNHAEVRCHKPLAQYNVIGSPASLQGGRALIPTYILVRVALDFSVPDGVIAGQN